MIYFAYGSNMNYEHMRRLCGWHFNVLGVGTLREYEFGPDKRGFANIHPKKGLHVIGVIYDVDQSALDTLDDFEGYPKVFDRKEVQVQDQDGENYKAWVYMEDHGQFGGTYIKPEYLKRVIAGAIENRLPEGWLKFLRSFEQSSAGNN